jgi:hypothetical protein
LAGSPIAIALLGNILDALLDVLEVEFVAVPCSALLGLTATMADSPVLVAALEGVDIVEAEALLVVLLFAVLFFDAIADVVAAVVANPLLVPSALTVDDIS